MAKPKRLETRSALVTGAQLPRLADFAHPDFTAALAEVFSEQGASLVYRKHWEVALGALALKPALHENARILGVGAGHDRLGFWLTRFAGEVHVTDMYAEPGVWKDTASRAMLTDPASLVSEGYAWHPERLIVQHMDGRQLRYPDRHFDAVYSLGSIEHFGGMADIQQAAREMARVVKPGGVIYLTTEFKLNDMAGEGWQGVVLFDRDTLQTNVIQPLGGTLDALTLDTDLPVEHPIRLVDIVTGQYHGPDLILEDKGYVFTSVAITVERK